MAPPILSLLWSNLVFITYQLFVRMFILYEYCFMFVWEIVAKPFIVSSLRKKHNSIALSCL